MQSCKQRINHVGSIPNFGDVFWKHVSRTCNGSSKPQKSNSSHPHQNSINKKLHWISIFVDTISKKSTSHMFKIIFAGVCDVVLIDIFLQIKNPGNMMSLIVPTSGITANILSNNESCCHTGCIALQDMYLGICTKEFISQRKKDIKKEKGHGHVRAPIGIS